MRSMRAVLVGALTASLLAACGGGGGEREFDTDPTAPTAPTPPVQPAPPAPGENVPASLQLTKNVPSMSSDGSQPVRLFATVKDAGNAALAEAPVIFSTFDRGAKIDVVRARTDASGQAEALLSLDGDPANRTIMVTAAAGEQRASIEIPVIGTTASIRGAASVVVGVPSTFQVSVRDASGRPVVGRPVSASSARGNALSLSSEVTGQNGNVDLTLVPASTQADTLTVTSSGAIGVRDVLVSSTLVTFDAPDALRSIVVGSASTPIRVRVLESGAPVVGASVSFAATRGALGNVTLTDGNGVATTTIESPLAGRSKITATAPNGTIAVHEVIFVADRAAKLEVQASPSTVGVNPPASTNQSSQIIAIVRDAVDNPVRGVRVNFSAMDPSAGLGLAQGFAVTDESGRATVEFYPGAVPTGTNEIVVNAVIDCDYVAGGARCVDPANPPADRTLLTAAKRALQVRIGTGNESVKVPDPVAPVFNEMPYGVLVTDSAGNPVPGVTLNATVMAIDYGKGYWYRIPCASGSPCWRQEVQSVPFCPSEDANLNLLLDAGEDRNGDGVLTPGNVALAYFGASGTSTTGVSDERGSSVLRMRYLRDRSQWVNLRVRVSASIPDGTEGAETVQFMLPILGSDLTSETVPPPGGTSPYGTGTCP